MTQPAKQKWYQKHWAMLLVISTAYIAVFANVQGFKAMLPLVQDEFLVSRTLVGFYSSFYFLSTVVIAVFSGKIADYLGTKRGLILGVGITGIMIILHSFAPLFGIILLLAFFTGIAFSLITPSVNKGVIEMSEPSKRSFSMGIVHGGGGLGGFMGAVMLPFIGEITGWRIALLIGGIFAVIITLFIYRFYQPISSGSETNPSNPKESVTSKPTSLKQDLLALLKNRYLISFFAMGIVFGISISSVTGHYSLFLTRDLDTTATFAGLGLGFFHIGGVVGQPLWGLINEKVFHGNRRIGLSLLGILISGLALFSGLVVSRFSFPNYGLIIFSFLFGFCTMGVIAIYFTSVSELVSREYIGVVTGLALIFPRTSTIFAPPLFGLIADHSGTYALSWIVLGSFVLALTIAFFCYSGKVSPEAYDTQKS